MMISNLPSDLIMEILSRVPLNSLREVQLTCKQWNYYSKTQGFRKMHISKLRALGRCKGESQMIRVMNNNINLMSIFVGDEDPSFEHNGKLNEQVKVSKVYHCEGLLLCILKDDPRFLVWNPYMREKRWIQPRYFHTAKIWEMFIYALGYEDKKDKSSRSCCVKLLRFIDYSAPENQFFWYEVYDFESGLWTTFDVTPHWRISGSSRGISIKGNNYWLAEERKLDNEEEESTADRIICFDFTSERFGELPPLPFSAGFNDFVTLSCVREEKFAVLHYHNESNPYKQVLDIWITIKIEAQEVFWSKFWRVDGKRVPFIRDCFFIDEEKKIAMGIGGGYRKRFSFNIIGDAGYFRKLYLLREPEDYVNMPHMCAYVPSLLQIEQPAGEGQRKQESELEKRRWNENMSRLFQFEAIYDPDLMRLVIAKENQ